MDDLVTDNVLARGTAARTGPTLVAVAALMGRFAAYDPLVLLGFVQQQFPNLLSCCTCGERPEMRGLPLVIIQAMANPHGSLMRQCPRKLSFHTVLPS